MFICTIHSILNIKKLKEAGYDAIILGVKGCSIRSETLVKLEEVEEWKQECAKNNCFLYINMVKLFMEDEMSFVKECLLKFKECNVDGIYYSDEGVLYEAIQLGLQDKLIYQPETLVTNHNDVEYYLEQGIQSVSLAHELSLKEIERISTYTKNIEVLIHGYFSICYSRRELVKNYLDAIQSNAEVKKYDLIESTRTGRMPILQDENGTHIFSEEPISSIEELETLQSLGIYRFRVDSIFKDDAWSINVLNCYKNKMKIEEGSNHLYHQETILKKEGQ